MTFYFISPIGQKSYLLYDTFEETFRANGHQIADDIEKADVVFYDLWCGWGSYDRAECMNVIENKKPVIVFDFFDYNDTTLWQGFDDFKKVIHEEWAYWLSAFKSQIKVYFMRKMNKTLEYPKWVHPIECIQYPDHDFPLTTPHELFTRMTDVCFIGTWSKERESIINGLIDVGIVVDYQFTTERIPHDIWIDRHRKAKFYLSADGGGYGDERPYQLYSISALLQQKNNQYQRQPFVNDYECIKISHIPTDEELDHLKNKMLSMAEMWEVYVSGVNKRIKKFYTSEYRAKYILSVINKYL